MAHNYPLAALSRAIMTELGDARTTALLLERNSETEAKLAGTALVIE
jgi:hypothetical protein